MGLRCGAAGDRIGLVNGIVVEADHQRGRPGIVRLDEARAGGGVGDELTIAVLDALQQRRNLAMAASKGSRVVRGLSHKQGSTVRRGNETRGRVQRSVGV
jgi:hypothetical protein